MTNSHKRGKMNPRPSISIPALTLEAHIKRAVREHLRQLGFQKDGDGRLVPPGDGKKYLRALHSLQRRERLAKEQSFISEEWPRLRDYFADGSEVIVSRIAPRLELIAADTWQSRLFRLASLTWSVPVSGGYGRRLRFLVWDQSNGKLMGIIGLGDPVFNLRARDALIGWTAKDRQERLANVLDAYVLGAVPPYSFLLGGKLIACLLRTKDVRNVFERRYGKARGVISKRRKHPELVLITTTSALGRSSVYNRLALNGHTYFRPIGYTSGWGHFHIPQNVFELVRRYLRLKRDPYAANNRFGDGPNWRLRALRRGLSLVGLDPDLLCHGVAREVFVCELALNAKDLLAGRVRHPSYKGLPSIEQVAGLAKARWLEPRAARHPGYHNWSKDGILQALTPQPPFMYDPVGESREGRAIAYVAR